EDFTQMRSLFVVALWSGALTAQQTTVTLTTSANPAVYLESVTLTASVSPSSATGTVTFYDLQTLLETKPLVNGQTTLKTSFNIALPHFLTARYNGDLQNRASTSDVLVQFVDRAPVQVQLSSLTNPVPAGAAATISAIVSPAAATGSMEYFDGTLS